MVYVDGFRQRPDRARGGQSGIGRTRLRRQAHTCIARARTFGEVLRGSPVWYENSGLAEIAVNGAAGALGLEIGSAVEVVVGDGD